MDKIKPKLDFSISIITIIIWLIFIGIIYQRFINVEKELKDKGQRIDNLELKCNQFEIGFAKMATESKYIAENTDDIKKMLEKHIDKELK